MDLKYFKLEEFDSPDFPNSGVNMDRDFLQKLDLARNIAGIRLGIAKGFVHVDSDETKSPNVIWTY